jgi:hypothetical protein
MQAERLQIGRGEHGDHAGQRLRLAGIDLPDPGMAVGRADEIAVQHAGQLQIVDIVALALGEADVLDALALAAQSLQALGALLGGQRHLVHSAASWNGTPLILAAAY